MCLEFNKHYHIILWELFVVAEQLYIHTAGDQFSEGHTLNSPKKRNKADSVEYKCVCVCVCLCVAAVLYYAFILHLAALEVYEDERGACERLKLTPAALEKTKFFRENGSLSFVLLYTGEK